jgi:hypothetical protein
VPIPQKKDNEKQADYMGRCMHKVNKDNPKMENKQQVAICLNTYNNPKKKSKANEIEVDFTEDIKNMNKIKEPTNTAVTAPAPEIKAQDNIVDIPDDQNTESLDGEKIQTTLLQMQQQYKILHWQTTSFSQHKSFDEIVSSLIENTDEFIETYMGKYGRVIASTTFNITLANYKDTDFMALTDQYIGFLIGLNDMLDKSIDSDLLNIRDEILGSLNQLKYLLTLV